MMVPVKTSRVTPGAGTDGDDAVDALRGGLFGVA
jgi:hypothetical protein